MCPMMECGGRRVYCGETGVYKEMSSILADQYSAIVYKPKSGRGGGRGGAGSQPMGTAVHRSPNKLWRSNSIFNMWGESLSLYL